MDGSVHGGPTNRVSCDLVGNELQCDSASYLGSDRIALDAEIRDGCVRATGHDVYQFGQGIEYRVGLVAEF